MAYVDGQVVGVRDRTTSAKATEAITDYCPTIPNVYQEDKSSANLQREALAVQGRAQ